MSALPLAHIPRGVRPSLSGAVFTPWSQHTARPARKGVYETRVRSPLYPGGYWYGFSYWTGRQWRAGGKDAESARKARRIGAQRKEWRGLAAEPQ